MDYLTVKEAGEKWGISGRMVIYYCVGGRIKGTVKKGNLQLVPTNVKKPVDKRYKEKTNDNSICTTNKNDKL